MLEPLGYDCSDLGSCLLKLRERSRSAGFPHEIGIFLGYPAHDVRGFIENGGKNCRFIWCWGSGTCLRFLVSVKRLSRLILRNMKQCRQMNEWTEAVRSRG